MNTINETPSHETATRNRYAAAAKAPEEALCCPVHYNPKLLNNIPREVIEKDYGCGDPSKYLRAGETVLDLGSGAGKICFLASQVVGPTGNVIGVDMTDDMLEVARRNAPVVAKNVGFANVEFRKGRIQDLALDLDLLDAELKKRPIRDTSSFLAADELANDLRRMRPLVESDSVDVVVSNCVLNLVDPQCKRRLFEELFRVIKNGGRAVISDIVSDKEAPIQMQRDPTLWSGCISGAFTEEGFLRAFQEAGFHGIEILDRGAEPWQTVHGIEFRSMTARAWKGNRGAGSDLNQAVIYKGPFLRTLDDDGQVMERGKRQAVCDKTFQRYKNPPYREFFEFVEPRGPTGQEEAKPLGSTTTNLGNPKESITNDCQTITSVSTNETSDKGTSCC